MYNKQKRGVNLVSNFILEIGTEELPVLAQSAIRRNAKNIIETLFHVNNIQFENVNIYVSPCRIIIHSQNISQKEKSKVEEIAGPPKRIAYDESGNPTKALLGFASNMKIAISDTFVKNTEKGEYIYAKVKTIFPSLDKLLPELCIKFISQLQFPKSMIWNKTKIKFSRPIRWIVCILGDKLINLEFAGIKSSKTTFGVGGYKGKKITIGKSSSFFSLLEKNKVIPDYEERKKIIIKEIESITKKVGKPILYNDLIEEVSGLVEYPSAILGEFDKSFLEIPEIVITTVLKHHQKFFPVKDFNDKITPYFAAIKNGTISSDEIVREGYTKVISARLNDAVFFYKQDKKTKLEDRIENLKKVTYQEKLGSLYEKEERIYSIALKLLQILNISDDKIKNDIKDSAMLCKTDLITEMVKEFPELQGIMGTIYCSRRDIAKSLEEHYLPKFSGDKLPESITGSILSISDKIDNIVSSFILGYKPSGSNDPFGLRRQIYGIMDICVDKKWDFDLYDLLAIGLENFANKSDNQEIINAKNTTLDFIGKRLENWLLDRGFKFDEARALVYKNTNQCFVYKNFLKANAIREFRKDKDFANLIGLYKRANNIIKQAIEKNILPNDSNFDNTLFIMDEEKNLADYIENNLNIENETYENIILKFAKARPVLDSFFDKVLVMDNDEKIRNNRLLILKKLVNIFNSFADFSYINE
jgi:glycyl-tRNA synthetase beta chain